MRHTRPTPDEEWTWQCDQVIPSDLAAGRRLLADSLRQLETLHWCRRDLFAVRLAVDEALVNAISHGNSLDETKQVHYCCRISPQKIRVEIADEGCGFDPDRLPDPTLPGHLGCPHGRGVMLMRAFMSRVEFREHGSQVVLEKDRGTPGD